MSLRYEPALESLHISVKWLFLNCEQQRPALSRICQRREKWVVGEPHQCDDTQKFAAIVSRFFLLLHACTKIQFHRVPPVPSLLTRAISPPGNPKCPEPGREPVQEV